jgi:hypothetical protein
VPARRAAHTPSAERPPPAEPDQLM